MKRYILSIGCFALTALTNAQSPNFQWAKQMGGTSSTCSGISLATDASGNVYTTGHFNGTVDFDPSPTLAYTLTSAGQADGFVSKLDASGNFIWTKRFGGIQNEDVASLAMDLSGNVYITGIFNGTVDFDPGPGVFNLTASGSVYSTFVLKLTTSGSFVWAKMMDGSVGGQSITLDASNNVYITGNFSGTVDFDPGSGVYNLSSVIIPPSFNTTDVFVSKLDASGNFVWTKQLAGSGLDYATSIAVDVSGNVYTTGYFEESMDFDPGTGSYSLTTAGLPDVFISKLNASGNFVGAKQFGSSSASMTTSKAIRVDANGNIYTMGSFEATIDFDPGAGVFNLSPVTASGSPGYGDIFLSKLDNFGNFVWAKQIGGVSLEEGNSFTIDATGDLYITGSFQETADFDPGVGTYTLTSNGGFDIFISKIDASGNFVWAKQIGGNSVEHGNSVAVDPSGNIYTTGSFQGAVDFDPGPATSNLNALGTTDVFVHKISTTSVGIKENTANSNIVMYPNPNKGILHIQFDSESYQKLNGNEVSIELSNALGQVLMSKTSITDQSSCNIQNFPAGIYIVKIICNTTVIATQKIIKE